MLIAVAIMFGAVHTVTAADEASERMAHLAASASLFGLLDLNKDQLIGLMDEIARDGDLSRSTAADVIEASARIPHGNVNSVKAIALTYVMLSIVNQKPMSVILATYGRYFDEKASEKAEAFVSLFPRPSVTQQQRAHDCALSGDNNQAVAVMVDVVSDYVQQRVK